MPVQKSSNLPLSLALVALVLFALMSTAPAWSQPGAPSSAAGPTGYNQPPQNILDVMHAPGPRQPIVSPTHDTILLVSWQRYPSIARVATPFLRLAGVRVETKNHSKHDTPGGYGITPCATGYDLVRVADGMQTHVALPAGACPGPPHWAADGKHFAFANIAADAVELWIGDVATGNAHRVPGVRLNPMFGDELQWMPDQKTLLVKLVPDGMGAPPPEPIVPIGPSIQETTGEKGQSSTYENRDTLSNTHDEDLFDYYATSQLALVDAATGAVTPIGKPGNYYSLDPAPDGRHILVATIHKPYSYVTTYDRFPHEVEVWDVSDRAHVASHTIASLPLADRVPIDGVALGPRDFDWRATDPATLIWAEALDGGDWNVTVPARDKIMLQKAPFTAPAVEIARTDQRYEGFEWSEQPGVALLAEDDENRHWKRTFVVNVDDPAQKPRLLWDLSTDEHYANPGNPVRHHSPTDTGSSAGRRCHLPWRSRRVARRRSPLPRPARSRDAQVRAPLPQRQDRPTSGFLRSPAPTPTRFLPGTSRRPTRRTRSCARWQRSATRPPVRPRSPRPAQPSPTSPIPPRRCAPSRSAS